MEYNIINVENCEDNDDIYSYLKRNGISESYIRKLRKKEGYILLNNKIAFTNAKIKNGDEIKLFKQANNISGIIENSIPLDIVYEDEDILVINKPSNLATTPSKSHPTDNLASGIVAYMKNKNSNFVVRVVNRLDKDTAGLVCIAKHCLIANTINKPSYIQKKYYAVCEGLITENITINKPILTVMNNFGYNDNKRIVDERGKPAITHIKPISYNSNNSLIELNLEYGRTHQIRVHLSSINHSLVGDKLYGKPSTLINHTALCCYYMKIFNPLNNKIIELKIDLPDDFKPLLSYMIKI